MHVIFLPGSGCHKESAQHGRFYVQSSEFSKSAQHGMALRRPSGSNAQHIHDRTNFRHVALHTHQQLAPASAAKAGIIISI
jgi:hypothetical protein